MIDQKLKAYLDQHHIKYIVISHSPAVTSQEIAQVSHVSGKALAKTVIVSIENKLAMVVLPANAQINFAKLRSITGSDKVELAQEREFKDKFPGCEVGAMPPFGNLYNMPVFLANELSKMDYILFNAGSHSELIQMSFNDFERLTQPKIVAFS